MALLKKLISSEPNMCFTNNENHLFDFCYLNFIEKEKFVRYLILMRLW